MSYDYETLYRATPQALGAPTDRLVRIFETLLKPPMRILDIGCGQGRDALFLAERGFSVVGVDLSPSGITDMLTRAQVRNLDVTGYVADIADFAPEGLFDVILFDRTLHMLRPPQRMDCLRTLLGYVGPDGFVIIEDEPKNLPELQTAFDASWQTVLATKPTLVMQRQ